MLPAPVRTAAEEASMQASMLTANASQRARTFKHTGFVRETSSCGWTMKAWNKVDTDTSSVKCYCQIV
jgi:hypothetical protein